MGRQRRSFTEEYNCRLTIAFDPKQHHGLVPAMCCSGGKTNKVELEFWKISGAALHAEEVASRIEIDRDVPSRN